MKLSLQLSLLGLCAALSASTTIDAKTMKKQQETVTTEEIETESTSTQPRRMRLLPGAQRRAERRRGVQPKAYTHEQHSSSKSVIRSTNGGVSVGNSGVSVGGVSVNITSPHVSETKDNVVVTMNIAGLSAQDIAVEVEGNDMYITGEYNHSGTQISINDSTSLPCAVDANRMNKKVSNGVLTITFPKMK